MPGTSIIAHFFRLIYAQIMRTQEIIQCIYAQWQVIMEMDDQHMLICVLIFIRINRIV